MVKTGATLLAALGFFRADAAFFSEQFSASVSASVSSQRIRQHLKDITAFEHVAGTEGDHKSAQLVLQHFKDLGWNAWIEEEEVLLNYPLENYLGLMMPSSSSSSAVEVEEGKDKKESEWGVEEARRLRREAVGGDGDDDDEMRPQILLEQEISLSEPVLPGDETSDTPLRNMTFFGYAPSGEAVAPFVYVNFGTPEDFAELERMKVDVRGKIGLARYGKNFRGLKVKNAEERGMKALLIYSDPEQDGEGQGPAYPEGATRPKFGMQRGSVQFNSLCPGDPGSPRSQKKCGFDPEELIPRIPCQPLSWGSALEIFKQMGGQDAPKSFVGGIPDLVYKTGPSSVKGHLKVKNEFMRKKIWNVVAELEGAPSQETPSSSSDGSTEEQKSDLVLLGNHRDAWIFGAADPNSGTACLMEIAKVVSEMVKDGWEPSQTIRLLSWDGEEYGLLGSTAYVERHRAELLEKAVAYLNVDVAVSGLFFDARASPSMKSLVLGAAAMLPAPTDKGERGEEKLIEMWQEQRGKLEVGPLGSGSDYTAFLDHTGVASFDSSFNGIKAGSYGQYHSIYDSFSWMDKHADPGFRAHKTMTSLWLLLLIAFADPQLDDKVLPLNATGSAEAARGYIQGVKGAYEKAGLSEVIGKVEDAALAFLEKAEEFDAAGWNAERTGDAETVMEVNRRLKWLERSFLDANGLKSRKYFKHMLVAPGLYLGYGAQTLPGMTEAAALGCAGGNKGTGDCEKEAERVISRLKQAESCVSLPSSSSFVPLSSAREACGVAEFRLGLLEVETEERNSDLESAHRLMLSVL
uniref:Peptidase M28 domain-containing protein n=1 Tax=Chromera velia CCMP2878 TaxID=1169474 RepID=A0A0G4GV07_9ALVE|mmetsp:Transcript_31197/g.61531  ORF Transcript_31197/g.61531 Transcript_31197/m.61531 type:complete len:803 (+) Transcript_31197:263-2671(+)|eukprot:Cvel_5248.t1-p1 / transcript=Cvel_5248.t1 / gene=Cvel_5248 / organism=Chromera_velia_CCMP2878 / gene_product=Glutamate carboxypeptidase 2, putative / transcript_product=Glutamate carboxypeptidase 2, putative / location=Cvel_scaffold242:7778-18629(+) / protein_length=802 / sequence_SO=supercontig / SO=protein_coding / is_pseudo=false